MNIKQNTAVNLTASVFTIIVSLVTVPLYLKLIGDTRYGVLAIVWLIVGYFGLFDLGLSRATANQMARLVSSGAAERQKVFWTALAMNGGLGILGGCMLFAIASVGFEAIFKIPGGLRPEMTRALPWVALSVPVATTSAVLNGTLEGHSRFLPVNSIQVSGTILAQIAPIVVAYVHGPSLEWLVATVVLSRFATSIPSYIVVARVVPIDRRPVLSLGTGLSLLRYGGWVAVTNVVSPLLDGFDRLLIGGVFGARFVTYYTVPFNVATKIGILPMALSRTLFPVFSHETKSGGSSTAVKAIQALSGLLTPLIVCGILFMRPFLQLWVGEDIATRSFGVGEIVLLGVWLNGLAIISYTQLQGQSRPDFVAKLHLMELAPFAAAMWIGLRTLGITGAAVAWTVRVTVDAIVLFWAAGYLGQVWREHRISYGLLVGSLLTAFLSSAATPLGIILRLVFAVCSVWWVLRKGSVLHQYIEYYLRRFKSSARKRTTRCDES